MEKSILGWVLITTSALIFGKAFRLLDIDWFWAFFPFIFTMVLSIIFLLLTNKSNGKE
jgi:hypothetical protein